MTKHITIKSVFVLLPTFAALLCFLTTIAEAGQPCCPTAAPNTLQIPTLSEWGLIAMAGILGLIGLMAMCRKYVTS